MLASYGFSRTLTPITIGLLLKGEQHHEGAPTGWFARMNQSFERGFETMRNGYTEMLGTLLRRRAIVPVATAVVLSLGGTLFVFVGRDFFPIIDGGQIQLHVRAPAGTRIEKTEQIFQAVEDKIREVIPENERDLIVDNIGLPARSYNFAFGDGTAIGVNGGVILVDLSLRLRDLMIELGGRDLHQQLPGLDMAADIDVAPGDVAARARVDIGLRECFGRGRPAHCHRTGARADRCRPHAWNVLFAALRRRRDLSMQAVVLPESES